jgi:hypothetical protein
VSGVAVEDADEAACGVEGEGREGDGGAGADVLDADRDLPQIEEREQVSDRVADVQHLVVGGFEGDEPGVGVGLGHEGVTGFLVRGL